MANSRKSFAKDLNRGFVLLLAGCTLFAVGVFYLEWRFENRLRYQAPHLAETSVFASDEQPLVAAHGETVYVPAYSHVYHQDGRPLLLTVALYVRNTDRNSEIALTSVRYYDSRGKEVRSHLDKSVCIEPFATAEFLVERNNTSGGSGASFIVEWTSEEEVTEPIIETVMIDTERRQGISFARRGINVSKDVNENENENEAERR